MPFYRLLLEAFPVILAVIAIFACGNRAITTRRSHDRRVYVGMVICATMMITAQSSWTYTMLKGMTDGTDLANVLWTVFNASVMTVFILAARRVK